MTHIKKIDKDQLTKWRFLKSFSIGAGVIGCLMVLVAGKNLVMYVWTALNIMLFFVSTQKMKTFTALTTKTKKKKRSRV